jgi:hypothetical protein
MGVFIDLSACPSKGPGHEDGGNLATRAVNNAYLGRLRDIDPPAYIHDTISLLKLLR